MSIQSEITDKWRIGCTFKNEKIYIFGKSRILVAKGWPQPMAWSRTKTISWHPTRKWADKMLSLEMYQYSAAGSLHIKSLGFDSYADVSTSAYWQHKHESTFGEFVKTFPEDIFNAAMQYAERRWQVLCLLSRCPEALDLHNSNPAILFCLANNWVFHKPVVVNSMRAARALIKKKQREILAWLGFPNSENARHILSKIDPSEITVEGLLYLRDTLNRGESLKPLSHLPKLNREVLRILCDPRISKILSYSALAQTAMLKRGKWESPVYYAQKIINLLNINSNALYLDLNVQQSINNIDDIGYYNDKFIQKLDSSQFAMEDKSMRLPLPPFQGSETIKPVSTENALIMEGEIMRNCVATHFDAVLAGHEYIYHVVAPIRATFSIGKSKNGFWELVEIKGFANKAIDPSLVNKLFSDLLKSN